MWSHHDHSVPAEQYNWQHWLSPRKSSRIAMIVNLKQENAIFLVVNTFYLNITVTLARHFSVLNSVIELLVCWLPSPRAKPAWSFWTISLLCDLKSNRHFKQWAQRQSMPCMGKWLKHPERISSVGGLRRIALAQYMLSCKRLRFEHRETKKN